MKTLLPALALLALPVLADSLPPGWMVLKDPKNVCQVGAPADFKPDPSFKGLAKGPGDTIEVQVLSSPAPVKPIMEAVAKVMNIDRLIENTDKRLFYVEKPLKGNDGRMLVGWTVKVARQGGNCSAVITTAPGGPEDLVKKIAATVGPAK